MADTSTRSVPFLESERAKPLHFAGRLREMELLDNRFAHIRETSDARVGLILVTGVPGAGKTTLCREFLDRHQGVDGTTTMVGDVTDLDNAADLFLTMGQTIGRKPEFEKIADVHTRTKGLRAQAGVPGVAGAGVGTDLDHVRRTGGFHSLLRRSASDGLWRDKSLVILIDELQNIKPEQAETLQVLHGGAHGCPVMVIGAGLQHTRSALSTNGISRIDDGITLGPLHRDATCEALAGALSELEIEPPDEIVEQLAAASHDFPQHIQCYVAASKEIVGAPVGWRDPDTVGKVLREGDKRRARYYKYRLDAMKHGRPKMLPVIAHMRLAGVTSMPERQAERVVTGRRRGRRQRRGRRCHPAWRVDGRRWRCEFRHSVVPQPHAQNARPAPVGHAPAARQGRPHAVERALETGHRPALARSKSLKRGLQPR